MIGSTLIAIGISKIFFFYKKLCIICLYSENENSDDSYNFNEIMNLQKGQKRGKKIPKEIN